MSLLLIKMNFYPRPSPSKTMTTTETNEFDENSDISFVKRQRELRSLYSDFRNALESMKLEDEKISQTQPTYFSQTTESDINSTYAFYDDEIRSILDEIRMLIAEVIGIKAELRASAYQNHIELFEKLDNVIQILTAQRQRAESLLVY